MTESHVYTLSGPEPPDEVLGAIGVTVDGADVDTQGDRPRTVVICGSLNRAAREIDAAILGEMCAGHRVFAPVLDPSVPIEEHARRHRWHIDHADEVLVVCPDGYIGDSTRSEIQYAEGRGVPVRYTHELERAQ